MTKRIVSTIVLAGMLIGSTSAFASRARDVVMGSGEAGYVIKAGSIYYDSMYNFFYNPAYINDFKNWAIIEKGPSNAHTQLVANGEGGFATSFMNFNLGVFMNRTDAFSNPFNNLRGTTGVNTAGGTLLPPGVASSFGATPGGLMNAANTRPIDVTFGGDMGVKWGLGLTWASGNGGTAVGNGIKQTNLDVRAGVSVMDFDPFINWRVIGKQETAGQTLKNKDITVGLRYRYGEWSPFAAYRMTTSDDSSIAAPFNTKGKGNVYTVGIGRNTKLGEGARLVYDLAYVRAFTSGVNGGDGSRRIIPINVALEGDATSWLTLRGGVEYHLMDTLAGVQSTNLIAVAGGGLGANGTVADTTTARIGATVHVNKVDVDWAYGNQAAQTADSRTFGFDGGTFTYASVSYKW